MKCLSATFRVFMIRPLLAFVALNFHAVAWADFDASDCAQVAGTNAIHWRDAKGTDSFCEEIEYVDVTEEVDGSFTLRGTSRSNGGACIGLFNYSFTVAADGLSASGRDTVTPHDMLLTRSREQGCFVGRWTAADEIWVGHFSSYMFGVSPSAAVPSLGLWQLGLLASLMGLTVWVGRRFSRI